jgi:hypothetical protein
MRLDRPDQLHPAGRLAMEKRSGWRPTTSGQWPGWDSNPLTLFLERETRQKSGPAV